MPAPANRTLSALWYDSPDEAKRTIVRMYRECGCDLFATARALRVSKATMYRWLKESPDLRSRVNLARHQRTEQLKAAMTRAR
jgi:transposase-like protein